ncbi:hypothetical protein BDD12DRAFT_826075 [Trichophaea hybrida]|nr:hypothetical protein BDD12DRAFT_826075 [Trichophaea hybrida]
MAAALANAPSPYTHIPMIPRESLSFFFPPVLVPTVSEARDSPSTIWHQKSLSGLERSSNNCLSVSHDLGMTGSGVGRRDRTVPDVSYGRMIRECQEAKNTFWTSPLYSTLVRR